MLLLALSLLAPAPARTQPQPGYASELQARAHELGLDRDIEWRRLLHNRWTPTGRRSEAAAGPFFLSAKGRADPAAELAATLASFFDETAAPDRRGQCRFPARYAWLKARLAFDPAKISEPACPAFEQWRALLSPQSVFLVFADAYLNNPSSMYGHTFLILHRQGRPENERLLDYAVNFAADADTNNGALFAIYGLSGFFPGKFSVMPYYLKVQEYNNLESRDLWEYRLNLSSAALDRLMRHLWELDGVSFPYYFFNKNCSYQLMPLLDVADGRLRLADRWPLYVIPSDTLRQAQVRPGLVSAAGYRPSHVTRLLHDRAELSPAELSTVEQLALGDQGQSGLAALTPQRQALALNTASEYLEYLADYRKDSDPRLTTRQHGLHLALGKLGEALPARQPNIPAAPEAGHFSARAGLGLGLLNSSGFEELSLRLALHDPLDPSPGYIPMSALEMFNLRLRRLNPARRVYVESLDLARILSLTPLDRWIKKPSWQVEFGMRQASDLGGKPWDSPYFGLTLGSGLALRPAAAPLTFYALAQVDSGAGPVFDANHRAGPGVSGGLFLEPTRGLRLNVETSYWYYILGDTRSQARLRFEADQTLAKNWAARLRLQRHGAADEMRLELHRYF